jgi:thioesterase domain-containing protein
MNREAKLIALNDAGKAPALYCVHTAAGHATTYKELAGHLAPDIPVYGFEAAGFRGDAEPYHTVEDMAQAYVDKILEVQPTGPYHVLGFSAGGLVAYEVGRVLMERQRQVRLLALLDAAIFPERIRNVSSAQYIHRSYWILLISVLFNKEFEWLFNKSMTQIWADTDTFAGAHPFWELTDAEKLKLAFDALPTHSKAQTWRNASFDKVERYAKFLETQWIAIRSYQPKRYPGHFTYFEAADTYDPHSKEIWGEYADSYSTFIVPGSHLTMLTDNNVISLATDLRRFWK